MNVFPWEESGSHGESHGVTLLWAVRKGRLPGGSNTVVSPEEFEGEGLVNEQAGGVGREEEKMF